MSLMRMFFLLIFTISLHLQARPLAKEPGWGVTINVNMGVNSATSQFVVHDDNEVTDGINNSGTTIERVIAYPLGRIQYTFDDLKTQYYLGNSRDQVSTARFQYELGFVHKFENKTKLTLAYFPELSLFNETWADPFQTATVREKTEQSTGGGRIALERIAGSPLTLKYVYAQSEIENEQSGSTLSLTSQQQQLLDRETNYHGAEIETIFPVSRGFFMRPSFQFTQANAQGEANSYQQYNVQLSTLVNTPRSVWITTLRAGKREFDTLNPVFNETQDTVVTSIFSIYTYKKPFNWQKWSATFMAGYSQEDANIDFYDSKSMTITAGLTYQY